MNNLPISSATYPLVPVLLGLSDRLSDALGISVPQIVDMNQLRSLPPGTFGRAWADSLDQQGLKPLTSGPRRKQLHDGIHVLTGYGIDPLGEAEVQAFLLGAKFRLANVLLGLGLLHAVYRQSHAQTWEYSEQVWSRLFQAYLQGGRSTFDPDHWQPETLWEKPLAEVQACFHL